MKKVMDADGCRPAKGRAVIRTASDGAGNAPKTAGTFLNRGIAHANRGKYETVVADFTEAINRDPNRARAYVLRGKAVMASISVVDNHAGDFDKMTFSRLKWNGEARINEAIADFNAAIRIDPHLAVAYLRRGHAYREKGDHDRAIADYTEALRINPHDANAYHNRGNAYASKGEYAEAIADFTEALRLDPHDANAYHNRDIAYAMQGDYARARADGEKVLHLDPNLARNNLERVRGMERGIR
jgi:tetratricopeptide (TPR) repeat protein